MSSAIPLTSSPLSPQGQKPASVEMVSFHHDKTHWQVKENFIDELLKPAGLKMTQWNRNGQLEIIKNGPHRTVYHLKLLSGGYFLKHFKADDKKTKLRQLVTSCRAELEYRAVQRVAELGIPTFETVAIGKQYQFTNWGVTDNYLVSKEITNVISVQDYVNNTGHAIPAIVRHQLATKLGDIVGTLHNGGLLHRDLHSDNLLMKITDDQQLHLWLIDLHAVSFVKKISIQQIEKNLSLLIPSFFRHLTKSDFLRFFCSYWKKLHENSLTISQTVTHVSCSKKEFFSRLIKSFRKTALEIFVKQDKKWSRGNRRLIIANNDNTECRGLANIGKERLIFLRDNPSEIRVTAFQEIFDTKEIVIRKEKNENFSARNAWEMGHAFLRRGFKTPRPIMFVVHQNENYFVTEDVTDLPTLSEKLQKAPSSERNTISRQLASSFAQLHTFGYNTSFSLNDLRVGGSSERTEIWFCNLDCVTHSSQPTAIEIVASFRQLYQNLVTSKLISYSETLRFLKQYTSHHSSIHWKQFFKVS
ncbi:hypothetical protein MNBD_PLANCTO02-1402 [hydrothermal vent metagenome]|uniref:non-specific serine/threonine protein kinase n=1 Tax=hydrothermal vent metagenome TaxID=652676 RepID=A0A3B1DP45_9ZZZZ